MILTAFIERVRCGAARCAQRTHSIKEGGGLPRKGALSTPHRAAPHRTLSMKADSYLVFISSGSTGAFSGIGWLHYEHNWRRKRTKYTVPQVDKGTSLHFYYVKMCRTGVTCILTFLHNSGEGMFLGGLTVRSNVNHTLKCAVLHVLYLSIEVYSAFSKVS